MIMLDGLNSVLEINWCHRKSMLCLTGDWQGYTYHSQDGEEELEQDL